MLNAVFCTLTYRRDSSPNDTWLRAGTDFNRFAQRVQRNFGSFEYLRVLEAHKDNFPHLHVLLCFRDFPCLKERGIFLRNEYYCTFKRLWDYGHTDFQCPKHSGKYPIGYILKYLSKSTSTRTLWSRILDPTTYTPPPLNELGYPIRAERGENVWKEILVKDSENLIQCDLKIKKIKLCSWSRGFTEMFKSSDS